MILTVYVNDILLTDNDSTSISETNKYLRTIFVTKDIDKPRFFLDIEFAYTKARMALS